MNFEDTIDILTTIAKAVKDPTVITDKLKIIDIFQKSNNPNSNNNMNNSIYAEPENSNIEYNKSVPIEDSKSYNTNNNTNNNDYYNKQQDTSSNPQGVIDSIAQELTSARLKQAIILSEIVGKPRSKTRQKRRF